LGNGLKRWQPKPESMRRKIQSQKGAKSLYGMRREGVKRF
jgi:hypothetical protein